MTKQKTEASAQKADIVVTLKAEIEWMRAEIDRMKANDPWRRYG